jgi:hypothetical protein
MGLVLGLQDVRDDYMKPMVINSGVRCEAHNERVKGYFNSEHLDGEAVDIRCCSSMPRFTLIELLLKHGFRRIGIDENFIHAGIGILKTQDVIWIYRMITRNEYSLGRVGLKSFKTLGLVVTNAFVFTGKLMAVLYTIRTALNGFSSSSVYQVNGQTVACKG